MSRCPRLDAPGALHHVIVRGIERRRLFRSAQDRQRFLDRLGTLVIASRAALYAWALMPNYAHALLRTGALPLSRFAQRWLGPYATTFNRVHHRAGHLSQNRFKSILVDEEAYLLELVRYIHLNPVPSRLPVGIDTLDTYPWTGHAVILGQRSFAAQDADFVLSQFGTKVARRAAHTCNSSTQACEAAPPVTGVRVVHTSPVSVCPRCAARHRRPPSWRFARSRVRARLQPVTPSRSRPTRGGCASPELPLSRQRSDCSPAPRPWDALEADQSPVP